MSLATHRCRLQNIFAIGYVTYLPTIQILIAENEVSLLISVPLSVSPAKAGVQSTR